MKKDSREIVPAELNCVEAWTKVVMARTSGAPCFLSFSLCRTTLTPMPGSLWPGSGARAEYRIKQTMITKDEMAEKSAGSRFEAASTGPDLGAVR